MLNLSYIFDDACQAMSKLDGPQIIVPLPATLFMLQADVINHYRRAMDESFATPLTAAGLQNSSLGTPYQKWAFFANKSFHWLSFTIRNLLTYSRALMCQTGYLPPSASGGWLHRMNLLYDGPLLMCHSHHDEVVPFEHGQLLYAAAQGSEKKLVEFDGGRHNDGPPQEFILELAKFFERLH